MDRNGDFSGSRAVVTGGSGFIGSHLVDALLSAGSDHVTIVDCSPPRYLEFKGVRVEYVQGDIRDFALVRKVVSSADFVFHHGAIASVPECSSRPDEAYSVNTAGCAAVLRAIHDSKRDIRVVFASSAAVYGNSASPIRYGEAHDKNPHSIYGSTKSLGEEIFAKFSSVFDVRSAIVRYANVYGPRQPRYIVFDMFHKVTAATTELEVLGSGLQERDFVYVDDAVRMTMMAASFAGDDDAIFNIGTGRATNVLDVARAVAAALEKPNLHLKTTGSSWIGDVDYLLVDVERARNALGPASRSLGEGISETVDWFRRSASKS